MEKLLPNLLHGFDNQPATSGRLLRELLEKDRDAFLAAAAVALRQTAQNRGYRYLIALLAGNNLLAGCVRDLSLSMPTALTLARIGMQIDPTLDITLARSMVEVLTEDGQQGEAEAIRTLEILGEISDGPRLLPLLTNVLQYPNPRLRSKVALLIGRRRQNARWAAQHQEESDPRVRANAIEGLWGMEDEGARAVLWEASLDANNRVAGNALLGLYRMGDTRAIPRTLEMAGHRDRRFRVTAAWVMGESADPRFAAALGRMLADSDNTVRARAFQALSTIRRRTGAREQTGGLQVHLWEARRLAHGERRLCVATVDKQGALARIAGTQFLVSEGDRAITEYEVRRRPAPALLAIGFGLPRIMEAESDALERRLGECLRHKKSGQTWAIARYSLEPADSTGETVEPPRFSANHAVLARLIQKRVLRSEAAGGLAGAARLLLASAARLSGERHVVLVGLPASPQGPEPDMHLIGETARLHGVAIHGLAVGAGSVDVLRALSAATGGRLLQARNEGEALTALRRIFWGLQYQDEIHYRVEGGADGPAAATVQVWSDLGMTEDCLALD